MPLLPAESLVRGLLLTSISAPSFARQSRSTKISATTPRLVPWRDSMDAGRIITVSGVSSEGRRGRGRTAAGGAARRGLTPLDCFFVAAAQLPSRTCHPAKPPRHGCPASVLPYPSVNCEPPRSTVSYKRRAPRPLEANTNAERVLLLHGRRRGLASGRGRRRASKKQTRDKRKTQLDHFCSDASFSALAASSSGCSSALVNTLKLTCGRVL